MGFRVKDIESFRLYLLRPEKVERHRRRRRVAVVRERRGEDNGHIVGYDIMMFIGVVIVLFIHVPLSSIVYYYSHYWHFLWVLRYYGIILRSISYDIICGFLFKSRT